MRPDVLPPAANLRDAGAVVSIGLGRFGAQVLDMLGAQCDGLPARPERLRLVSVTAGSAPPPESSAPPFQHRLHLPAFDVAAWIDAPEHATLRGCVSHLPAAAFEDFDAACRELPAMGLVVMHRYDEERLVPTLRQHLDTARDATPEGRVRCRFVADLGEGLALGMLPALLQRLRETFAMRRVEVEVVLAVMPAAGAARRLEEVAVQWEALQRGSIDWPYPGRQGTREDRVFRRLPPARHFVFCAGPGLADARTLASAMARSLFTLDTTPLGNRLDEELDVEKDGCLERFWLDGTGMRHPTSLTTFHVGGLSLETLPALFHLRTACTAVERWIRPLDADEVAGAQAAAEEALEQARLCDANLVEDLKLAGPPLRYEELRARELADTELYAFLSEHLDRELGRLLPRTEEGGDAATKPVVLDPLVEKARLALGARAVEIANRDPGHLGAALEFYRHGRRRLHEKRVTLMDHAAWAERELGSSPSRRRLDQLLERLRQDTQNPRPGDIASREHFGATLSVAVSTQVRKILDTAAEVRVHALAVGTAPYLAEIYAALEAHCEERCLALQQRVHQLQRVTALAWREAEAIERARRSPFTYRHAHHQRVIDTLLQRIERQMPPPEPPELSQALGGDVLSLQLDDAAMLTRVLDIVKPEVTRLHSVASTVVEDEPVVVEALREALDAFAPGAQIDPERVAGVPPQRLRFALCPAAFFERHAASMFENTTHVEAPDPYRLLVLEAAVGFPFAALQLATGASAAGTVAPGTQASTPGPPPGIPNGARGYFHESFHKIGGRTRGD